MEVLLYCKDMGNSFAIIAQSAQEPPLTQKAHESLYL